MLYVQVSQSNGTAAQAVAAQMLADLTQPERRVTAGADKGFGARGWVQARRQLKIAPHVSQKTRCAGISTIDGRATRHVVYGVSQHMRRGIEQCVRRSKATGPIRRRTV